MADSQDLKDLENGEPDMSRRDFRNADLAGILATDRDFSSAHLQKATADDANFSRSVLSNAHLLHFRARNASFNLVEAQGTVFHGVDFQSSDFSGAKLIRSIFTKVNFSKTNLSNADFSNCTINEGCQFEGAIINAGTKFDGVKIFRPLSREHVFRFYRVERGVLIRSNDKPEDIHLPAPIATSNPPTPDFPSHHGTVFFDYTSYDGRSSFGQNNWLFNLGWSNASNSSIHLYRNNNKIAVARGITSIGDITEEIVSTADFTSGTRTPHEGEIVLCINPSNYLMALRIIDILARSHGDSEDRLTLEYQILVNGEKSFSAPMGRSSNLEIISRVQWLEAELRRLRTETDINYDHQHDGRELLGHNGPPEAMPLTAADAEETFDALTNIREQVERNSPADRELLKNASAVIQRISAKILNWVGARLNVAADAFAHRVGTALGEPKFLLSAWLVVSGRFDALLDALMKWLN